MTLHCHEHHEHHHGLGEEEKKKRQQASLMMEKVAHVCSTAGEFSISTTTIMTMPLLT
jgi:hypothetical protein